MIASKSGQLTKKYQAGTRPRNLPAWHRQAPVHSDRPGPANVGKWGTLNSPPGRSRPAESRVDSGHTACVFAARNSATLPSIMCAYRTIVEHLPEPQN